MSFRRNYGSDKGIEGMDGKEFAYELQRGEFVVYQFYIAYKISNISTL